MRPRWRASFLRYPALIFKEKRKETALLFQAQDVAGLDHVGFAALPAALFGDNLEVRILDDR